MFRIFTSFLLVFFLSSVSKAQPNTFNYYFKITSSTFFDFGKYIYGGTNVGLGFGCWYDFKRVQPSFNLSINGIFGKNNLGNRDRFKNKYQVNTIFSPMLSVNLSKRDKKFDTENSNGEKVKSQILEYSTISEEIPTFYYGNTNAVLNNYKSSFTIGTSFNTMPKGVNRTLMTPRNRSQQLIILSVKKGFFTNNIKVLGETSADKTYRSLTLNLQEDYLGFTDNGFFQWAADNFDRFFTGGGNVQFRLNNNYKIAYYTEVYTGTVNMDYFDNPDIYIPNKEISEGFLGGPIRVARYATQESGQKMFNTGRSFFLFDYVNQKDRNLNFQGIIGYKDGIDNMWSQNKIHNQIPISKVLPCYMDTTRLYKNKKYFDRFHRFYPNYEDKRFFIAFGSSLKYTNLNLLKK